MPLSYGKDAPLVSFLNCNKEKHVEHPNHIQWFTPGLLPSAEGLALLPSEQSWKRELGSLTLWWGGQQTHGLRQNWFSVRTIRRYWGWECRGALTHFITFLMREIVESTAQSTHKCLSSHRILEGTCFYSFSGTSKARHSSLKRICLRER